MADVKLNTSCRFSGRVCDYVLYRPSYPVEVVRTLEKKAGLAPGHTRVVDLGCGTGISAALFLNEGYAVTGIEPNAEMRAAALEQLGNSLKFKILDGAAENIPLADASCELVIAAQAFHWFDKAACRNEMARILVPGGYVALLWNDRRPDSTDFLREYERILHEYGTDYAQVNHRNITDADVEQFFKPGKCMQHVFKTHQDFNLEGLKGRALSSSYVPGTDRSDHADFMQALAEAFNKYEDNGKVRFEYDTRLYYGQLS